MSEHKKYENRVTRCKKCNETFKYRYKIIPNQGENLVVNLSCPFCKASLKVDLSPYSRKKIISYKSENGTSSGIEAEILELPAELPTLIRE